MLRMFKSYAPYEVLAAPGREKPEIWRLVVGIVLCLIVMIAGQGILIAIYGFALGSHGDAMMQMGLLDTPGAMIAALLGIACFIPGVMLALRWLHKRRFWGVIGDPVRTLKLGARVAAYAAAIQLLLMLPAVVFAEEELILNTPPMLWLVLLPIGALVVLLQTSAEEIFFRGYIQSQMAARFQSPIIWMGIPAIIFAIGHYAAVMYGDNAAMVAVWAGLFGLLAADLTARTGSLGPAMGLHFMNNALVILFVSMDGPMSGLSLYVLPFSAQDAEEVAKVMPLDFVALGVSWLAARVAVRA